MALFCAGDASAQPPVETDPLETMPIRFGQLGLNPTLTITNLGVDTNIFNSAAEEKQDFTTTITPRVEARLRTGSGKVLLTGAVASGFVYFHKYSEERAVDYVTDGRVDYDMDRFRPYASVSVQDTRERLNAELDVRAPRTQTTFIAGGSLVLSPRTGLVFDLKRSGVDFAEGVFFEGVLLSRTLNSDITTLEGGVEFHLTPLTTFSVVAARQQDRFSLSPERDSNSFSIAPTLRMDSPAIVQGSISVGFRRFDTLDPLVPNYTGMVIHGSLNHTVAERTKFDLALNRDVQYSFELNEPFYLTTGYRLTVSHQLLESIDLRATGGQDRLAYREELLRPTDEVPSEPVRTDRADLLSGGFGYRFRPTLRIGFDVEYARRVSARAQREYNRTRMFASLTYGL